MKNYFKEIERNVNYMKMIDYEKENYLCFFLTFSHIMLLLIIIFKSNASTVSRSIFNYDNIAPELHSKFS